MTEVSQCGRGRELRSHYVTMLRFLSTECYWLVSQLEHVIRQLLWLLQDLKLAT